MTESGEGGVEFWQNCEAPKWPWHIKTRFREDGSFLEQRITDAGGVEYRRAKTTAFQRQRGMPNFVWQRKMWRMKA